MTRQYKLNNDLDELDNILDGLTFQNSEKEINAQTVRKAAKELLEMRLTDFNELLDNNVDEIVKVVSKRRS